MQGHQKSFNDDAANEVLRECDHIVKQMRDHLSQCHCHRHGTQQKDIFQELKRLDDGIWEIQGAQLLVKDVLNNLGTDKSWPLMPRIMDSFKSAGSQVFKDSAKEMFGRLSTFQYQKFQSSCIREMVRSQSYGYT